MRTKQVKRQFRGVWISAEIWTDPSLSPMEKFIFTEINSLDCSEEHCYASNRHFKDFFGIGERQVSKYISELQKKGFIKVEIKGRNERKISIEQKFYQPTNKGSSKDRTKVPHSNTGNNTISKTENGAFSDQDRKELMDLFEPINPSYRILFARNNQNDALKRMFLQYGRPKLDEIIKLLPLVISRKFAPRITTPLQLEAKMGELIAFVKQENEKVGSKRNEIAIAL